MHRGVRRIAFVAGLAAAAGLVALAVAHRPASPEEAARLFVAYAKHPSNRGAILFAAGAAMVSLVLALVAAWTSRVPSGATMVEDAPALSPFRAIEADLLADMLADLGTRLRALTAPPSPDIVGFLDALIDGAVRVAASDIHLHPLEAVTNVAFRVQGILEDVVPFPADHHRQLVTRLKVLGRLNTFRSDSPQDGHFSKETVDGPVDIRLSVLPTNHGEKAVLRLASVGAKVPDLKAIGLPPQLEERYRQILTRPQGVVFLTGPTGSGKTTTIYGSLGHIKHSRGETTQIATIEDPIEFDVRFLTQTQVNPDVGLTFAQGLRSILRQDPNVIMVGEIRDPETAHIAIQAGLTGHQIVTTVHADSAAGAFNRLIEMGVEPFLVASATLASLSQRLVRGLCPHCRVPTPPSVDELSRLTERHIEERAFYTAPGCKRCGGTGYLGRRAIFELLEMTPRIRDLVNAKVPTSRIHEAAMSEGMVPLITAAIALAKSGGTSLREVFRVVG